MLEPITPYEQRIELLSLLRFGELSGQKIRDVLAQIGIRKDGPAFYQWMGRLEDAKLIKGRYGKGSGKHRERHYILTKKGVDAYNSELKMFEKHVARGMIPVEAAR